jgi:glutaredoxin 3
MAHIELYGTSSCPYCTRAKNLLNKKQVEFVEIDLDSSPERRDEMEQRAQRTSVPQIFIDDFHVGGFDDLVELDMDGELDQHLGLD